MPASWATLRVASSSILSPGLLWLEHCSLKFSLEVQHFSSSPRFLSSTLCAYTMSRQQVSDGIESVEDGHDVIMAIDMRESQTLGCAYYSSTDACLYISEDSRMADMELVERLLLHGEPTTVLLCSQLPENIHQIVTQYAESLFYSIFPPNGVSSPYSRTFLMLHRSAKANYQDFYEARIQFINCQSRRTPRTESVKDECFSEYTVYQ